MKSKLAEQCDPNPDGRYTELLVLQSNAGYYIGTLFIGSDGFVEPGSRDSEYFDTREEAQKYLQWLEAADKPVLPPLRERP